MTKNSSVDTAHPSPSIHDKVAGQPHAVDVLVGNNLRRVRLLRGVSQTALAKGIGITFQQVQKYEKGANRVSASKLWEISRFLEADIQEFFVGVNTSGNRTARPPSEDELLHFGRVDLEIIQMLRDCDESVKTAIRDLLRETVHWRSIADTNEVSDHA